MGVTPKQLAEWRRLCEAASPGPWGWYGPTQGEGREFVVLPRGMIPCGVPEWEAEYGGEA